MRDGVIEQIARPTLLRENHKEKEKVLPFEARKTIRKKKQIIPR